MACNLLTHPVIEYVNFLLSILFEGIKKLLSEWFSKSKEKVKKTIFTMIFVAMALKKKESYYHSDFQFGNWNGFLKLKPILFNKQSSLSSFLLA